MLIKIPFTNIEVSLNAPDVKRRALAMGGSVGTLRDMSGYKLSYESLFSAYRNQSDIYSCIRELRENVGLGGYKWGVPGDDEEEVAPAIVAQLESIFNFYQPYAKLESRIVRDMKVAGNAYVCIDKAANGTTIIGLSPIDPRTVAIISDKTGVILKYIQRIGSAAVEFDPSEIIHFYTEPDPNHEVFGFSPMEPIIWEARTDMQAMMSNYYFFENDATPALQYILDDDLSLEAQEEAIKMIKDQFQGTKNKGRSGVLAGVKEIKSIGINQKDMEYLQGRKFTTEKICAAYGVPKFMLGYTDTVNNNNGVELKLKFYEGTIQPIESTIAQTWNRQFIQRILGLFGKVEFKYNPQSFDEQNEIESRALDEFKNGTITLRQYKKKTGKEITPEDEKYPNFDAYIIHSGASSVLLEDVGVDPFIDEGDGQVAQNLLNELKKVNGSKQ